jgi:hypothetical protein
MDKVSNTEKIVRNSKVPMLAMRYAAVMKCQPSKRKLPKRKISGCW